MLCYTFAVIEKFVYEGLEAASSSSSLYERKCKNSIVSFC